MIVIWALGTAIIWRLRRFHICAVYVVSFIALAFLRAWITGDPWQSEISPITGPEYQLFIFFMITDPKTTVRSKLGQCVVAFSVALVEFFLRLDQSIYAPLYALFIVGPIAMLIEMWMNSRRSPLSGSGCCLNRMSVKIKKEIIFMSFCRRSLRYLPLALLLVVPGCKRANPAPSAQEKSAAATQPAAVRDTGIG